ncbi:unnamed protein product [Rotaria sp. Silwood1]|nr:unnamed protein product [Rotaria sp. Silwood1]
MNTDNCPAFNYSCDLHRTTAPYNTFSYGTTFYPAGIRLSNGTILLNVTGPPGSFGSLCSANGCTSDPSCGGPSSGVASGVCRCRESYFVPPYIICVRRALRDYTANLTYRGVVTPKGVGDIVVCMMNSFASCFSFR